MGRRIRSSLRGWEDFLLDSAISAGGLKGEARATFLDFFHFS